MRVYIVGQAPRSFDHDKGAEVWVVNGPHMPPVWDRLFQIHGLDHITHKHGPGFVEWLGTIRGPERLYMTKPHLLIPYARTFPIDLVKFSAGDYLTSSFPMILEFARLEGATEIILDGVMWAGGSAQWGAGEGWAVPCVEYHIGRLRALGVKVTVPPGCGLFAMSGHVYGYEGPGSV